MSDYTHPNLYHDNQFITPWLGGSNHDLDFNKKRYDDQMKVIKETRRKLPKFDTEISQKIPREIPEVVKDFRYGHNFEDQYDPYLDWLGSRGLIENRAKSINTRYVVDIDSRHRNIEPTIMKGELTHLSANNPLEFIDGSNEVIIHHPNHGFEPEDKISILGVLGENLTLLTNTTVDGSTVKTIQLTNDSNEIIIKYPHGLGSSYFNTSTPVQVSVDGVKSNLNNTYLDSIPINFINKKHNVVLDFAEVNGEQVPDPDYFKIIVNKNYEREGNAFNFETYTFNLNKEYVCGIPLKYINADFPVRPDRLQGYHEIISTTNDTYTIRVNIPAQFSGSGRAGGNSIQVAKIEIEEEGSADPSKYSITLPTIYHNVVSVKIISSIFPITQKSFTLNNNKLYWQNLDDGNHVYSLEIDPGNYQVDELVDTLHNKFYNTPRINTTADASDNQYISNYTSNQFVQIGINIATDKVSFRSFRETILTHPIINTEPPITEDSDTDSTILLTSNIKLTINHSRHNLNVGDIVLIQNSIPHLGIPSTSIDGEHEVIEVVDKDSYKIQLDRFNFLATRVDTKGGNAVYFYTPNIFRLRFDYDDTMGEQLGFRNVGDPLSITKFATNITNFDEYEEDALIDVNGLVVDRRKPTVNLSGKDYILMAVEQLNNTFGVGPIKEYFTKIIIMDIPGKIVFNSFVNTNSTYKEPIAELSQLDVTFYNPDGTQYDFGGFEHSYTLEIISEREIPRNTGISVKSGKQINYDKVDQIHGSDDNN